MRDTLLLLILTLVWPTCAGAWHQELPNGEAHAVAADGAGDVVAVGQLDGDFAVVKLAGGSGTELWRQTIDGTYGADREDIANAVALDAAGDAIAVGTVRDDATYSDLFVVKFAGATGAELWRQQIDGPASSFDSGAAVALDGVGDVLVAGRLITGMSAQSDFTVMKFDGATGAELWRHGLTGTDALGRNEAIAVAVDGSGDVLAAGLLYNTDGDFVAVKLSGTTGAELWRKEYDGASDGFLDVDVADAVVVDAAGDAFVGGRIDNDFAVVKLASASGTELWRVGIDGAGTGNNDTALSLVLAPGGDVVAAGELRQDGGITEAGDMDFMAARLAGGTGTEVWRYVTGQGRNDRGFAVALDGAGDVAVAGHLEGQRTFQDLAVVKLAGATGVQRWVQRVDGTTGILDERLHYGGLDGAPHFGASDRANAVTVSSSGGIVAAGQLMNVGVEEHFAVLAFDDLFGALGPVRGGLLTLRDRAGDPGARSINATLRDPAIVLPPPGSPEDPRGAGATVRLTNPSTLESASFVLPAGASWRGLGHPAGRRGYDYRDAGANGPCTLLRLKPGFVHGLCSGRLGSIPYSLDEPAQGSVAFSVELGGAPQCAVFGGTVLQDAGTGSPGPGGAFTAKDAPGAGAVACP